MALRNLGSFFSFSLSFNLIKDFGTFVSESRKYDDNYVTKVSPLYLQFGNAAKRPSFSPIIITGYSMHK